MIRKISKSLLNESEPQMHGIVSTVLKAFRLTYETLAGASYGDTTAYTAKLHIRF